MRSVGWGTRGSTLFITSLFFATGMLITQSSQSAEPRSSIDPQSIAEWILQETPEGRAITPLLASSPDLRAEFEKEIANQAKTLEIIRTEILLNSREAPLSPFEMATLRRLAALDLRVVSAARPHLAERGLLPMEELHWDEGSDPLLDRFGKLARELTPESSCESLSPLLNAAESLLRARGIAVERRLSQDGVPELRILPQAQGPELNRFSELLQRRLNQAELVYNPQAIWQSGFIAEFRGKTLYASHQSLLSGKVDDVLTHEKNHALFRSFAERGTDSLYAGSFSRTFPDSVSIYLPYMDFLSFEEFVTYANQFRGYARALENPGELPERERQWIWELARVGSLYSESIFAYAEEVLARGLQSARQGQAKVSFGQSESPEGKPLGVTLLVDAPGTRFSLYLNGSRYLGLLQGFESSLESKDHALSARLYATLMREGLLRLQGLHREAQELRLEFAKINEGFAAGYAQEPRRRPELISRLKGPRLKVREQVRLKAPLASCEALFL